MAFAAQAFGNSKADTMVSETPELAAPTSTLALALIISSQAPVVLLDGGLNVIAASVSFYRDFDVPRGGPARLKFADLGSGEWNVPQLLMLLCATAAGSPAIEAYEIDLVRLGKPTCRLVLSADKLDYDGEGGEVRLVLTVTDVTAARLADKQKEQLVHEKQVLMQELQHRVANSLQIIASVLMQSARKANSEEARRHLKDAHHRVMSVATLQKQLAIAREGEIGLRDYFTELCESISASMISEPTFLTLIARVDDSKVDARVSASLGLIVTELVVNSLKHAFPVSRHDGTILVEYRSAGTGWILRVSDDGVGFPVDAEDAKPGLGTGIVEALATQLEAVVTTAAAYPGTTVTIEHAASMDPVSRPDPELAVDLVS